MRRLLTVATTPTLITALLFGASASAAPPAKSYWPKPTAWSASTLELPSDITLQRPRSFTTGAGDAAVYVVHGLRWSGWGSRTAVGRGRVRLCEGSGSSCLPWRPFRIELGRLRPLACGDWGGDYVYTRYRGYGLHYDPRPGRTWVSDYPC